MAGHQRPLFVLFGASMTQLSFELGGRGAAFQDLYQRKHTLRPTMLFDRPVTIFASRPAGKLIPADFLLRGYSGWNTRRALAVRHELFSKDLPTQPALVVVFFGANDVAIPVPSGMGYSVPIEKFKENLVNIASSTLSDT